MFEFPGPGYEAKFDVGYRDAVNNVPSENGIPDYSQDPNKKIVVTYSSINGNGYGGYGEIVMGTKGTLVLEKEKEVMLFQGSNTSTRVGVKGRWRWRHARYAGQWRGRPGRPVGGNRPGQPGLYRGD